MNLKSFFIILLVAFIVAIITLLVLRLFNFNDSNAIYGGVAGGIVGAILGARLKQQ